MKPKRDKGMTDKDTDIEEQIKWASRDIGDEILAHLKYKAIGDSWSASYHGNLALQRLAEAEELCARVGVSFKEFWANFKPIVKAVLEVPREERWLQ